MLRFFLFCIKISLIVMLASGCSKWQSAKEKLLSLKYAEIQNRILKDENAKLQIENDRLRGDLSELQSKSILKNYSEKSLKQTGSSAGRTLSSIDFEFDKSESPESLYERAITFLTQEQYEKAVKILDYLRGEHVWKDSKKMYYPLGIAYYHISNYFSALEAFEIAKAEDDNLAPKILIWKSLIYKNMGDLAKYRETTRTLALDYGNSREAFFFGQAISANQKKSKLNLDTKGEPVHHEKHH